MYYFTTETHTTEQFLATLDAIRMQEHDANMARISKNIEGIKKLNRAGFNVVADRYNCGYFVLNVDQKDLTKVYRALGRLKKYDTEISNGKKKTIEVTLVPADRERFPNIYIKYQRKLPRGAKCKIVSKRVLQHQLVCEAT